MRTTIIAAAASTLLAGSAVASEARLPVLYEVRVTNVTAGTYFTPTLAVTHAPGASTSLTIPGRPQDRLSLAAMLLPTNDGFYAVDAVQLPPRGKATYTALGYDAGSEFNDELCVNIPGPQCGGAGLSPEDGEGYVHVHPGTHGMSDLNRASYDWRNPVALVTVTRVK